MSSRVLLLLVAFLSYCSLLQLTAAAKPQNGDKANLDESRKRKIAVLNFFAGGIAGTVSSTLTAPLEVIKTQMQSSRMSGKGPLAVVQEILKADGPAGFFRGLQPLLVGIIPTRGIYFGAYSTTKAALNSTLGNSPLNHVVSAFSAGITSNTITSPLWVVKTRFQILPDPKLGQRSYKSYKEVVQAIYREEGPPGFFKGLVASYVGCFEGALQWIVYEKAKAFFSAPHEVEEYNARTKKTVKKMVARTPTAGEYFMAAAFSKFTAILATYPHEVVRTRMREQAKNGVFRYTNFIKTLQIIAKEEGRQGLYGGIGIHLMRSVPNSAIMFLTFELASRYLNRVLDTVPSAKLSDEQREDTSAQSPMAMVRPGKLRLAFPVSRPVSRI